MHGEDKTNPEEEMDGAAAAAEYDSPGLEPEDGSPEDIDPIEALTAERDEANDRMLRMAAETENYKKRSEREKAEFFKRSNERLLKDLLPVLDNLERAMDAGGEAAGDRCIIEGLDLTQQELWKVLDRHGLEKVESLGQTFNPEFHEAVMQQEDPDSGENTILQELQKGYLFHGRLLRPAMVIVSKKPADIEDEGSGVKVTIN